MKASVPPLIDPVEKIFHEPNRLAIMSALCAEERGLTFSRLKEICRLTDGNLNRHLKALEDVGAVRISKAFVQSKPCTTIRITEQGLSHFSEYLDTLAGILKTARQALPAAARTPIRTPRTALA